VVENWTAGRWTPLAPPYIPRRIFHLHVLALKYCCSTWCQYIGVAKCAHTVALLWHDAPSENGYVGCIGWK
jgi:hypothetical protein